MHVKKNIPRPSKSYSHLHVGEGWKQTDTGFPITLYVWSVSLANGRGCARLAHAWGGWVWGALLVWGGWAPTWGVGPAGLLVRALGKYYYYYYSLLGSVVGLDPEKRGSVWPSEPGTWRY